MSRRPSWFVRWLRRSPPARPAPPAAAAPAVTAGPRSEEWLVVSAGSEEHRVRAAELAAALAGTGVPVSLVDREGPPAGDAASGATMIAGWDLATLRRRYTGRPDRLRVLVGRADAQTIALARDLGADGARVAYDAEPRRGASSWYETDTEKALVDAVEDLIAPDAATARHLSSLAGGGRLVHLVSTPLAAADRSAAVAALAAMASRPSIVVLLATDEDPAATLDAARAFMTAREDGAYRLVVVAFSNDPAGETLEAWEEEGRLRLLRSARSGREAAWNLGLSATRSEWVALVHARQRPIGAGWLSARLGELLARREVGAVGAAGRATALAPDADPSHGRAAVLLDASGLVAHRSVLRRLGGFDESLGGLAAVDLGFRIRDLGLELSTLDDRALRDGEPRRAAKDEEAARRELRRRWAHRPEYLAAWNDED